MTKNVNEEISEKPVLFRDQISKLCIIDGVNFADLDPQDRITRIGHIMKNIFDKVDEADRIALDRAKKEKGEAEKLIGGLKDKLATAEKTIQMHQDDKTVITKKLYGHWDDVRYGVDRFMKMFFGADMTTYMVQTFFGPKPVPPQYEAIQIGPDPEDTLQVPLVPVWTLPIPTAYHCDSKAHGKITEEKIQMQQNEDNPIESEICIITTKRRKFFWEEMFQRIVNFSRENSIFRGKIFDSSFKFINTDNVTWDDVILHPTTKNEVQVGLEWPVKYKEYLTSANVPFRRGILLSGKYGVGKTMLAKAMANDAHKIGISFIMVRTEDIENLSYLYALAGHYGPSVLFCEDIDRIVGMDRTQQADMVLNILDGVQKVGDVMTVFTTNHINNINPALQRPGRIDEIITIGAADAEGRMKLIVRTILANKNRCDKTIETSAEEIAKVTEEFPGSFIVEAVKSATQRAVLRAANNGTTIAEIQESGVVVDADDVIYGAQKLRTRAEAYKKLDPSKLNSIAIGGSNLNQLLGLLTRG